MNMPTTPPQTARDRTDPPPSSHRTLEAPLFGIPNPELRLYDPLWMNLLVAKGIPSLHDLEIEPYQKLADEWAADLEERLPRMEARFRKAPGEWKNDVHFFRLGALCWYLDERLGIRYREDQRNLKYVSYTDPTDLFLNGVMDTRRGTCANMAALHVAVGWRLKWPVSLACVGSHLICRYDDGKVTHNIEATNTGKGGFHSHPDEYYMKEHQLSPKAVQCGSDLRAVSPREMLGVFIGLRARHYDNLGRVQVAERDYLLARALFPQNRNLHNGQVQASVQMAARVFDPHEKGHPEELAQWLPQVVNQLRRREQEQRFGAYQRPFVINHMGEQP